MNAVLLDTDVVSFALKGDTRAESYRAHVAGKVLVVSFMTVAELYKWALLHGWGVKRRKALEESLRNFVVHPFDRSLCLKWAEVNDSVKRAGRTVSCADAWVAATALRHGIPLITHNTKDFITIPNLTVLSAV